MLRPHARDPPPRPSHTVPCPSTEGRSSTPARSRSFCAHRTPSPVRWSPNGAHLTTLATDWSLPCPLAPCGSPPFCHPPPLVSPPAHKPTSFIPSSSRYHPGGRRERPRGTLRPIAGRATPPCFTASIVKGHISPLYTRACSQFDRLTTAPHPFPRTPPLRSMAPSDRPPFPPLSAP